MSVVFGIGACMLTFLTCTVCGVLGRKCHKSVSGMESPLPKKIYFVVEAFTNKASYKEVRTSVRKVRREEAASEKEDVLEKGLLLNTNERVPGDHTAGLYRAHRTILKVRMMSVPYSVPEL